jgi:lysophospholipase L1-like esterase
MKHTKPFDPAILATLIIVSLLLLYALPVFKFGNTEFKRIDILADLKVFKKDSVLQAVSDSIQVKQDSVVKLVEEHCRPGLTCIEDYSGDSSALKIFFKALASTKERHSDLRIAFYGDSFIEGDVLCGSFRDTLQSLFGGRGVGFVPITSSVTGFRNTIKHRFENWETQSLIVKKDSAVSIGPAGYSFKPLIGNWVEYSGSKQRFLREWNTAKIYYTNTGDAAVQYTVDGDSIFNIEELKTSKTLQEWSYQKKKMKSVKLEFYPSDGLTLYGASFEGDNGIYVDNFSIRGNTGLSLSTMNDKLLKRFGELRNYKLIILQFGVNLVTDDSLNYRAYTKRMVEVVKKLKLAYPKSSFLLLSVGDRSSNKTGRLETMNAVPAMRNAQRAIAEKTKIAFWDMYEAMGGKNSMVEFAQAKPPLAAKDYTHLTFKGGRILASSLVKSLLYGMEKYEKKKKKK